MQTPPTQPSHAIARKTRAAILVIALLLIGGLAFVVLQQSRPSPAVYDDNTLANPPGMADRLDFFDTAATLSSGKSSNVEMVTNSPVRLRLNDPKSQYPRRGNWISPEITADFPFTELIPSWNPDCPPETGLRIDVRVRDAATGQWSPWFYLGCWGKTIVYEKNNPRIISDSKIGATVAIDNLVFNKPADRYQTRIEFYAFTVDPAINPSLRRISISYSGIAPAHVRTTDTASLLWAKNIDVPFRAQGNASKPLRPEVCSPTSVSMVMQYLGADRPTDDNALAIYDSEYDMFGNWGRGVAHAGQSGFDAWLMRFRNLDQVKSVIASGQPIIASIRFKKGEAPSFVMEKTAGHLIVIRGLTPTGDYIVNDPASKEKGAAAIYKADDMGRAWLNHGGVGYIIRKPQ